MNSQHKASPATVATVLAKARRDMNNLTASELNSLERFRELRADLKALVENGLGSRYTWSRRELAEAFGISKRSVLNWVRRGELPDAHNGKWDVSEVLQFLHSRLTEKDRERGLSAQDRYRLAKARREEILLAREVGQLIVRDSVRRMVGPTLSAIRESILGMADRVIPFIPLDQRTDARKEIESIAQAGLAELKVAFIQATNKQRNKSARKTK